MRFAIPLAFAVAAAAQVEAQYLHGRVTDARTGAGVSSASVLVLNPDGSIRTGAITDRDGRFGMRTTAGAFHLRVQRVGYAATASTLLELASTDTLDFAVRLPLTPTEIDPITVTAAGGAPLDPSGFYQRRDEMVGRFLGPYEVERRRPATPADLLNDIPGFQVMPGMGGNRVLMSSRGRWCVPTVYVDGRLAHRGTQTRTEGQRTREDGILLEPLVNANAIRAVEAYSRGSNAPVAFRPVGPVGGGDCGVLIFWTSAGMRR